jgi:hypothetical protein
MRRVSVIAIVVLLAGCGPKSAQITPAPIPYLPGTTFWLPRHTNTSDRVCLVRFGAEPEQCKSVDDVRNFLRSQNAAP